VKPENFLLGRAERSRHVYMIDFGLAKKYFDIKTRRHLPYREDKKLTGTARYASINTHAGCEQSRRDDLEALGYMLLYFLRGKLPWQGLGGDTKEAKYEAIHQRKVECSLEELCRDQPSEFLSYMRYCRSLSYEEVPNYSSLRKVFRDLWELKGYSQEDAYEWERVEEEPEEDTEVKEEQPKEEARKETKTPEAEQVQTRVAPVVDARIPVASSFVRKTKK
jgi:serine/threonine protein kinase